LEQADSPRSLAGLSNSNKILLVVASVLVVIMIVDVSLARVYDLIPKQPSAIWRIAIFIAIASISVVCQYFILGYVERKSTHVQNVAKLHFRRTHQIVKISQFAISAILVTLIFQTVFMPYYYLPFLIVIVSISYGLTIFIMAALAFKFLLWARSNKNRTIILYTIASASLSINAVFTLAYVNDILVDGPLQMAQYSAGSMVTILPNSITAVLNSGFFISSVISFSLLWGATAMLLHQHALKLGKVKYWVAIGSPLVLFLSQFVSFFVRLFDPLFGFDPVTAAFWTTIIFTLSKPIGGALFGIAFFMIARNLGQNVILRNYLVISACGFVLLYAANQASVLLVTPFPPFGVTSVAFVGFASYLVFLGIYSAAILISEDTRLRQLVKKASLDQSGLLDTVGTAHMKQEIQKKVSRVMKDNSDKLVEATGLHSLTSDDELKQYIDDVIKEVNADKDNRHVQAKNVPDEKDKPRDL
jgi:hypothetical protein